MHVDGGVAGEGEEYEGVVVCIRETVYGVFADAAVHAE